MFKNIEHVFFDLDNTLWDFDTNSICVLKQLIKEYSLIQKCSCTEDSFLKTYKIVNEDLWSLYREKSISKELLRSSRFTNTMAYFGYENQDLGLELEMQYISRAPYQKNLVSDSKEVLQYLYSKYKLHIITNGFKEIQKLKIMNCSIDKYFNEVIISEEVGIHKPDATIFKYALNKVGATGLNSLMIGDDLEVDIIGAHKVGMNTLFFNRKNIKLEDNLFQEIKGLKEIFQCL